MTGKDCPCFAAYTPYEGFALFIEAEPGKTSIMFFNWPRDFNDYDDCDHAA